MSKYGTIKVPNIEMDKTKQMLFWTGKGKRGMFCTKCGAQIPDGTKECPVCNNKEELLCQEEEKQAVHAPEADAPAGADTPQKKKKLLPLILGIAAVCLVAIGIILGVQGAQKAKLKEELMRGWSRVEESSGGAYYRLVLDFDEDTVDVNFETAAIFGMNERLATLEYKVISGNKIKILDFDEEFTIEFDKKHESFEITPALVDTDYYHEYWYNFD